MSLSFNVRTRPGSSSISSMDRLIYTFVFRQGRHLRCWKREREPAAFARFALDQDLAAHGVGQLASQAETQAGAVNLTVLRRFSPVEGLEDTPQVGRGDPHAVIFHGDGHFRTVARSDRS